MPEGIIGVRTPELRRLARELFSSDFRDEFLRSLPHGFFEENQLHAFIISLIRDFEQCIAYLDAFLPFVDNWATCDQMSPKIFKKYRQLLIPCVDRWLFSNHIYTVRFGIGVLMEHFLDEDFSPDFPRKVINACSDEYYVSMMAAWYFATALAKRYDDVLPYIQNKCLDKATHNRAIQKAVESYRLSDEQKVYLKTLKIK